MHWRRPNWPASPRKSLSLFYVSDGYRLNTSYTSYKSCLIVNILPTPFQEQRPASAINPLVLSDHFLAGHEMQRDPAFPFLPPALADWYIDRALEIGRDV